MKKHANAQKRNRELNSRLMNHGKHMSLNKPDKKPPPSNNRSVMNVNDTSVKLTPRIFHRDIFFGENELHLIHKNSP